MPQQTNTIDHSTLTQLIHNWSKKLGFQQLGITDTLMDIQEARFLDWLKRDYHGDMTYMEKHGSSRYHPEELVPGTLRVISVRMDYLPPDCRDTDTILQDATLGFISRYALGRDYHKLMRKRLQKLADKITAEIGDFGYRVFVDSAPVLEKPLAEKAGLGWIGKHTNLINQDAGSWFFLGEIYTDLPLPVDETETQSHCGSCKACIDICPTQAIVAPYVLDARRCISYLTIELNGSIPVEFRSKIGNRIYGCDDCQLVCPWNRFSSATKEKDFFTRHGLDAPDLLVLFEWSEAEFLKYTEGSAIRRIGYNKWLRNIAVALGNAPRSNKIIEALQQKREGVNDMVTEHIDWALTKQQTKNS